MFKKCFLAILLVATSGQLMATVPVFLERMHQDKFNERRLELPEQLLTFLPEGIRDCQNITNNETGRRELCGIFLKYYDRSVALFTKKEAFLPEHIRSPIDGSHQFISFSTPSGEKYFRLSPDFVLTQVYNQSSFNDETVRQISLLMLMQYFRFMMDLHYLSYGKNHIKGFLDIKDLEIQCQLLRKSQQKEPKGYEFKKEDDTDELLDSLFAGYSNRSGGTFSIFFGLLFGLSPFHYLEITKDKESFYIPKIDFVVPQKEFSTKQTELKKYHLLLAYELFYFSSRVNITELNKLAPLAYNDYRADYVRAQSGAGRLQKKATEVLLSSEPKAEVSQGPVEANKITMVRYACGLADKAILKETEPLQEKIKALEGTIEQQNKAIARLEADLAAAELLSEGKTPKKKNKNGQGKTDAETSPLKKELEAYRKRCSKTMATLKEKEALVTKLEANQKEFLILYNSMIERQKEVTKQCGLMHERLQEMQRQSEELTKGREFALETLAFLDESGFSNVGALLASHQTLLAENDLLREQNLDLRGRVKLASSAYRNLKEEHKVTVDLISPMATALVEAGNEREQAEKSNLELSLENSDLKKALIAFQMAEKEGISLLLDASRYLYDNIELDKKNQQYALLNLQLQQQNQHLRLQESYLMLRLAQLEAVLAQVHSSNLTLVKQLEEEKALRSKTEDISQKDNKAEGSSGLG